MKKTACFLFICFLCIFAQAQTQTQKGIVKTRGRMVNGHLVPGKGLPSTAITIDGRNSMIVRNNDGSFSFPVTGQTFRVTSAKKEGYQLVDADFTSKTHNYSANTLYILMEDL